VHILYLAVKAYAHGGAPPRPAPSTYRPSPAHLPIQDLDVLVDDLQRDELVVRGVDAADKVKTRCDTTTIGETIVARRSNRFSFAYEKLILLTALGARSEETKQCKTGTLTITFVHQLVVFPV